MFEHGAYSRAAHRGRCAAICTTFNINAQRTGTQTRRGGLGQSQVRFPIQTPQAFHRFPETAEEMTTHSHRRRQSIFQIDAALRAAATLFSIVTQDGQRRIFQRSQPTAPKRRIGLPRSVGEAGGTLPVRWVHTPNKSRFSLGRHSRFFGQGPKKWGGIALGFPSERKKQGRLPILPGEASCTS